MVDFSKILAVKADELKKPQPIPVGTYLCVNSALPAFEAIGKKETPAAVFNLFVVAAGEDVDPDALADWVSEFGEVRGKAIRHTMYLSENAQFRTKEDLCKAFNLEEGNKSLGELFSETVNQQVYVSVKHRPSQDGTELYVDVEKLLAV